VKRPDEEPVLPDQTTDDTDSGWGEQPDDDDKRLRDDVPPHHLDRD
jgi:hypothetical protein